MISISTGWRSGKIRDGNELLDEILDVGAKSIELEYRIRRATFEQMRPRLAAGDLGVGSIHNVFPVPQDDPSGLGSGDVLFSSEDHRERELAVAYAVGTIQTASELGARVVVFHLSKAPMPSRIEELKQHVDDQMMDSAGGRRLVTEILDLRRRVAPKAFDRVLSCLDTLVETARKYGVAIGVENRYHPHEIPDFDEIGRILDEFAGGPIGYWHDVGHAIVQERFGIAKAGRLLETYGPKTIGIHVHDVVGHDDHWAPGTGEVDFALLAPHVPADALRVVEVHSKVTRDELASSLELLERIGLG